MGTVTLAMRRVGAGVMLGALLTASACGTKAPPPAVTPTTSTLAATPAPRGRSPWANSKFFAPRPPAPAPLLSRPKRPIRRTPVHTLKS